MARKAKIDGKAIDRIRGEINLIRAFIRSLPHDGQLTDVDTLLSVAESEVARHKSVKTSE